MRESRCRRRIKNPAARPSGFQRRPRPMPPPRVSDCHRRCPLYWRASTPVATCVGDPRWLALEVLCRPRRSAMADIRWCSIRRHAIVNWPHQQLIRIRDDDSTRRYMLAGLRVLPSVIQASEVPHTAIRRTDEIGLPEARCRAGTHTRWQMVERSAAAASLQRQ